jgi:hypothetical protein
LVPHILGTGRPVNRMYQQAHALTQSPNPRCERPMSGPKGPGNIRKGKMEEVSWQSFTLGPRCSTATSTTTPGSRGTRAVCVSGGVRLPLPGDLFALWPPGPCTHIGPAAKTGPILQASTHEQEEFNEEPDPASEHRGVSRHARTSVTLRIATVRSVGPLVSVLRPQAVTLCGKSG